MRILRLCVGVVFVSLLASSAAVAQEDVTPVIEDPAPSTAPAPSETQPVDTAAEPTPALLDAALPSDDPVLVGAGDIADCSSKGDERTARLLDNIPGTVFTAGDNAYDSGTVTQFHQCYKPTWGRHRARTRPSPGNHDYKTKGASAYFNYFGALAGPPGRGYYSYDLGTWHIISLNSMKVANPSDAQYEWLKQDLLDHPTTCTLAYWHHPVFSSGPQGNDLRRMGEVWKLLDSSGADVVIAGHSHAYERFAKQDINAQPDSNGLREFVVGTGGRYFIPLAATQPNSEVRNDKTKGVMKMTLHPTGYDWQFVPAGTGTFTDSGSDSCVAS